MTESLTKNQEWCPVCTLEVESFDRDDGNRGLKAVDREDVPDPKTTCYICEGDIPITERAQNEQEDGHGHSIDTSDGNQGGDDADRVGG